MSSASRYRGQPLLVLLMLLGGWVVLRILTWQAPLELPLPRLEAVPPAPIAAPAQAPAPATPFDPANRPTRPALPLTPYWPSAPLPPQASGLAPAAIFMASPLRAPVAPGAAANQGYLLLAAFSPASGRPFAQAAPIPAARRAVPQAAPFYADAAGPLPAYLDRWSADGWLLLRRDTTSPVTSGRGSYGASQLGAVLRYSLAPDSAFRPAVYLRASQALAGAKESEAALGLSARLLPVVPVRAAAEARLTRVGGRTEVRPAVYAVTELPPARLPLEFTAEAYLQAGYVGGSHATGFVDGQLRAERAVARLGSAELSAGGGAWGGAQKDAARLDIGPSASLDFKLGGAAAALPVARLSMDWRFRIAGEAQPASGPALTLSAGF